tara:strand:+ start:22407 stop:22742 length:336 start_codon:yes stop_codon:yes gene_type:complete
MTELFAIFLVSCSHMLGVCKESPEPVQVFANYRTCEERLYTRLDDAVSKFEKSLPVAVGKCVKVKPDMALATPDFKWFFANDGNLFVEAVAPAAQQNATNSQQAMLSPDKG